jgi:general secretion pathway protein A
MYLSHYNLNKKPFQINPDPNFLWLGEIHKEALAILKYGILDSRGFLLLVGDVGTGKTTLINGLIDALDEDTIVVTVHDPGLEKLDFCNFLANAFKFEKKFSSKGDFLVRFIHFLHKAHDENKKVLLIIDEAQRLTHEIMEEIRLLSNIEKKGARLLNIFLVGQNEINEALTETRNRALLQRITTRYSIGPLKKNEVWDYIKFRLSVAGTERNIFNSGAIREIISFSKCNPRMINNICDHALLTGYVKGVKKIDAKIVKECAKELRIPTEIWIGKGKRPAWSIPVFVASFALLLIAGGYFYFQGRDDNISSSLSVQTNKNANNSGTTNQTENTASESLQVSLNREKKAPISKVSQEERGASIPVKVSQEEKGASEPVKVSQEERSASEPDKGKDKKNDILKQDAAGLEESKEPLIKGDTIKIASHSVAGDQKGALAGEKKQEIAEKIKDTVAFPDQKLTINFPLSSNDFSDEAYELLDRFAETIFQTPDAKIIIKGYTDTSGSESYNLSLSIFRANVVKSYFVGQGINPAKIKSFGMGSENPTESNATIQGRKANRRIEIELKTNKS